MCIDSIFVRQVGPDSAFLCIFPPRTRFDVEFLDVGPTRSWITENEVIYRRFGLSKSLICPSVYVGIVLACWIDQINMFWRPYSSPMVRHGEGSGGVVPVGVGGGSLA